MSDIFKPVFVWSSENDTIYWVDMGLSTISRAKRDQTWREDVVTNGIGRVEGITVDWIAGVVMQNDNQNKSACVEIKDAD